MTEWQPITFPFTAQDGEFLRIDGERYIVLRPGEKFTFATPAEYRKFITERLGAR